MPATRRLVGLQRRSLRHLPSLLVILGSILLVIIFSMVLPASFIATALIMLALMVELWRHRQTAWALPALIVYLTIIVWYYADIALYPVKYEEMPTALINYSYGEVLIFAFSFRLMAPFLGSKMSSQIPVRVPRFLEPGMLLQIVVGSWFVLFICALSRMGWDVLGALFPVNGRNGSLMWQRAAAGDAGPTGFLVSTGGYLYLLSCALFGIIFVLAKKQSTKTAAVGMMALTWPFFLLCGTRNQFLAVAMPCVFCYGLMGRQKMFVRIVVLLVCFLFVNFAFKIVIGYRNVGFMAMFEESEADLMVENMTPEEKASAHEGLNMIQELCYENSFVISGQLPLTWGWDYLVQVTGFVPRAIWPNKPMMGIDYAKARGYAGGDADIGVVATVSTGLIGQGVLEFGPFFGPLAPAFLMALWCGLLGRWWQQRASLLRLGLFLLGLGVTFNLGRDITNIALWPLAFAYLLVRVAEKALETRPVFPYGMRPATMARIAQRLRRERKLPAVRPAMLNLAQARNDPRPS